MSSLMRMRAPVSSAIFVTVRRSSASGHKLSGAERRTSIPSSAPATSSERAVLLWASPRSQYEISLRCLLLCSSMVNMSAASASGAIQWSARSTPALLHIGRAFRQCLGQSRDTRCRQTCSNPPCLAALRWAAKSMRYRSSDGVKSSSFRKFRCRRFAAIRVRHAGLGMSYNEARRDHGRVHFR